ncbi:ABC-type transport system ATP-binding protein [Natrialba magadii ATCC 43099]|uniref:ABC transporter n=1 Tax=Natrialba magadii (strain ATCC 43099 / DSM 3394 / CCM 3739 / CIP 104546 / IAM 13178 / JCM 8861 / NBRC 102185 / NCIMB 2190 / MS3) TaxID=547559 RepID=D3SYF5_NATMM|nr:ABC transporter ATP-binding protein [Natrialba magadii]ADD06126.1 ABC-type transport system ATP-binding protein [Natrialba magadii ATCC 43099]ELY30875.1 ABC transporter [Natrialba magadii ATCC 43099]
MAAIELTGLTKRFGDVVAVDGLDLTVEEGEIFGFLGPNGAGKSTTIDILLDFIRPTDGTATVLGHDAQSAGQTVRSRTGVLPDGYHVYDRLTGRQHVEFAVKMKGVDDDPAALLERVRIADAADRKAGGYSKGMRQRLVLAMALVGDPDLLILDEPSTGLDPNGAREMREIIREENDRGTTVFFSSHVMEQVEAVCDRVAIINRGRLVAVDTIDGLRDSTETGETLTVYVAELDEGVLERVRELEGVGDASIDDGRLRVTVDGDSKFAVLHAIDQEAGVQDFSVTESSLEDLFVRYTSEDQEVEA